MPEIERGIDDGVREAMIADEDWFAEEVEDELPVSEVAMAVDMPHDVYAMTCRPTKEQYHAYCDLLGIAPSARGRI